MPIFNITEQLNVEAENILIYCINESNGSIVYIDVTEDLFELQQDNIFQINMGVLSSQLVPGDYTLHIFGISPVLSNLTLKEISTTRYELRLLSNIPSSIPETQDIYRNYDLKINDTFYPILSSIKDVYAVGGNQNTLIIKLFTPLQDNVLIDTTSNISICSHVFDPVIRRIKVMAQEQQESLIKLPNADLSFRDSTNISNYQTILSTSSYSSSILSIFSASQHITPKVDFRYFQNHIFFGSAQKVLNNVVKKISDWVDYDASNWLISGSTSLVELSASYVGKQNEIVSGFTMYEKWAYSSSDGWPKKEGMPYHYTSSFADQWITTQSLSASSFDGSNPHIITNLVPEYYLETDTYGNLENFLYVLADHFDQIKIYIDHLEDMVHVGYGAYNTIPNEFMWLLSRLLGFELYEGYATKNLVQYLIGAEVSGSSNVETYRNITFETWNRILNNLIYIYKTKGTVECIRALLNCYGIPSTIMRIREKVIHGEYTGSQFEQYVIEPRMTRNLMFTSSQQISVPIGTVLNGDFVIESRIKTNHRPAASADMNLFGGTANFYISLKADPSSSEVGELGVYLNGIKTAFISSGAGIPFFDKNFRSIFLTVSGTDVGIANGSMSLFVKRYNEEQLFEDTSSNYYNLTNLETGAITSAVSFRFGGNLASTDSFTGSAHEIRIWNRILSDNELNLHTYDFMSVAMDNPIDEYQNNFLRWKLNENKDLNSDTLIVDTSLRPNWYMHGTASGWSVLSSIPSASYWGFELEDTRFYLPNLGPIKYSDKIRIGMPSGLIDTPKMSITFAPTDVINEDIMLEVANLDFNSALGDPGELYSSSYSDLRRYQAMYFSKYLGPYNFYNFINLVGQMDQSMYDTMRQLIPARVYPTFGLLIESHMLERPKYDWKINRLSTSSLKGSSSLTDNIVSSTYGIMRSGGISGFDDNYSGEIIEQLLNVTRGEIYDNVISLNTDNSKIETYFANKSISAYFDERSGSLNSIEWIENRGSVYHQLRKITFEGTQNTSGWQVSESQGGGIQYIMNPQFGSA